MKINSNMSTNSGFSRPSFVEAFKFKFNATHEMSINLVDLAEYLSKRMGSEWQTKDSEHYGDYISVRKPDTQTVFRVFYNDNGDYVFDVLNKKSNIKIKEWNQELDEFKRILEEKGASNFSPTENYY